MSIEYRNCCEVIEFTANLNIPLVIPYLMQDASKAEYAEVKDLLTSF